MWRLKQLKLLEFSLKFLSDSYLVKSTADKKHLVHMSAFVHLGMKHKLPAFFIYRWSTLTYEPVDKQPSQPVTIIRKFSIFLQNSKYKRPYFLRSLLEGRGTLDIAFVNKSEVFRLSHDIVTCDVDRDVSTAYCQSSSSPEFTTMNNHNLFYCFCRLRILSTFPWLTLSCVWRQMLISNSHAILALSERDKNILNTSVKSESYS